MPACSRCSHFRHCHLGVASEWFTLQYHFITVPMFLMLSKFLQEITQSQSRPQHAPGSFRGALILRSSTRGRLFGLVTFLREMQLLVTICYEYLPKKFYYIVTLLSRSPYSPLFLNISVSKTAGCFQTEIVCVRPAKAALLRSLRACSSPVVS